MFRLFHFIKACPAERWRDNCSLICPINYYGIFCMETYDCHPEEKCDFKLGCMHVKYVFLLAFVSVFFNH